MYKVIIKYLTRADLDLLSKFKLCLDSACLIILQNTSVRCFISSVILFNSTYEQVLIVFVHVNWNCAT